MTDLEKKLKNELDTYQIKTSSDDILRLHEAKVTSSITKNKKRKGLFFGLSLGTLSLVGASVVIALLIPKAIDNNTNPNLRPTLTAKEDTLLNNELSLLTYDFENSTVSPTILALLNKKQIINPLEDNDDSEDDNEDNETDTSYTFDEIVKAFDLASDSFYFLSNDLETNLKSVNTENFEGFTYSDITYYNESKLYYNETLLYTIYTNYTLDDEDENEWNFTGLLKENDEYFKINGTKELDTTKNEYELECNISKNNKKYSVSREIEQDESSYEFTELDLSNNSLYSYEINFDLEENETSVTIDYLKEYEFLVTKISNTKYNLSIAGFLIELTYTNNEVSYIDISAQ